MRRDLATWYSYFALGFFTYLLNIQGNILPVPEARAGPELPGGEPAFERGFLVYWGISQAPLAIAGLFVLGLGVALLYPLTLGFAIDAAGDRGDTASARFMLAVGLVIVPTPVLLGALADEAGLHMAHLMVPGLAVVALLCFIVAQALGRSRVAPARCS